MALSILCDVIYVVCVVHMICVVYMVYVLAQIFTDHLCSVIVSSRVFLSDCMEFSFSQGYPGVWSSSSLKDMSM